MIKPDASIVADIHCEALAGDFLPTLGRSFLTNFYECVITLNTGFGIIYEQNNTVIGAAVATENTQTFYRRLLLRKFWNLGPIVLWSLLKKPSLVFHALETVIHSSRSYDAEGKAELILLVLRKTYQRQGIGTKIMKAVNEEFMRRGVESYLVRIYRDNTNSNLFYRKLGFQMVRSFTMYGRKWNLLRNNIASF
jgi:ribosomal protein S18 acetylase RimI-like enzyme